jgi:hypothetical protein
MWKETDLALYELSLERSSGRNQEIYPTNVGRDYEPRKHQISISVHCKAKSKFMVKFMLLKSVGKEWSDIRTNYRK